MTAAAPLTCIIGPTAAGKTDLAVELVRRYPFDIISVDSAMIYRDMDIGTAKPDAETLRIAPHRLIDILDPVETYSAAEFRADALREVEQIRARGRLPLLVGGTMLYFRALEHGLSVLPPADPAIRAQLEMRLREEGLEALHAQLAAVDPEAARRIHKNDPQRIQRALEVFLISGRSMSSLHADGQRLGGPVEVVKLAVAPPDRALLHERIERRFHAMLEQGLVGEVERLFRRGDLHAELPSMRAVGYRQVWQYLEGRLDYPEMIDRGIFATRQYAKRQFTWLRRETEALQLDAMSPGMLDTVLRELRERQIIDDSGR